MSQKAPLIAYRCSSGVGFLYGPPLEGNFDGFSKDESSTCRDMAFSRDGSLFAWCNGQKVKIITTSNFRTLCEIDKPKVSSISLSPKGSYICLWEPYVAKANPQESCNLHVWDVQKNTCLKSFIQKKQINWKPEFSDDEHLCARIVSNEVHFFQDGKFDEISKKIFMQKVASFSLAPGFPDYHIACYVPGIKGQPSFVRLFMFPKFEGANAIIAQKSFFKADRVEFLWNRKGKDLIVQTLVDVDKSGTSYYGEQNLYFLSVKGETAKVTLSKDGPIYAIKWNPNDTEFCVVYGFMPAKATIFNLKCEAIFDFGTGPRNEIGYSANGTRLALYGFGNLNGNIEVWDLTEKKLVSKFTATDSTYLTWSSDGEYILTATLSPRLRIGNGYRIWHYTGSLLQERFVDMKDELWDIIWQPQPEDSIKEKATQFTPVPGIQSSKPEASKQVYRPPAAQGQPSKFKLHEYEPPTESAKKETTATQISKNKKKNLAKKAKKEAEKEISSPEDPKSTNNNIDSTASSYISSPALTGNPEKDKKIRTIMKKLQQIEKIKQMKDEGKQLELNQLEKLKRENELIEELEQLQI